MTNPLRLIVTDTSPLITLAVYDALDLLLKSRVSVGIPDAVYVEATRIRSAAGASVIVDWLNAHRGQAQIMPTQVGIDQLRRLEEGRPTRGLGEAAAIEALDRFFDSEPNAEALLLFEDTGIIRRRALVDRRVGLISTGDFLRLQEGAQLIQSSDRVLDLAAEAGRNVEQQRARSSTDESLATLRQHLDHLRDDDPT